MVSQGLERVDGRRAVHEAIGAGSVVASRFRLEDLLGEDDGARFWRATDLTLVRNVALHVIRADDPRASAVLTAARTSATVSDGRILRVLDALQEGDFVYVVHEWGSGVSLDRMLTEGPLDPRHAAWLVREVAEAITVAHRYGVAHGQLVPENVLLTDVGSVKLIGFVVGAVLQGRPRPEDSTPPPSEHEADVLNLGALLYACLTAKWPGYPPSSVPEAPYDHDRVCRPRQVRQGVPRRLDALCDQILNPDSRGDRRLESAAEIAAALGDFLGDSLSGATVAVSGPTVLLERPDAPTGSPVEPGADPDATQAGVPLFEPTVAALPELAAAPPTTPPSTPPSTSPPTGAPPVASEPSSGVSPQTPQDPMTRPTGGPAWSRRPDAGTVPSAWGPDVAPPDPTAGATAFRRPGGRWLRLAAVIAVLGVVLLAVVVVMSLNRDEEPQQAGEPDSSSSASTSPPEVLTPAAVRDFDPEQDGGAPEENPDMVPLATDGDPSTAWETLRYDDGPVLAPYKAGVGLLIDLGSEVPVRDVSVTLEGSPYDLKLLAAPPDSEAPTSVDGLTTVDSRRGASGKVQLGGDKEVTTRYLVVWLTALPAADGGFQGRIAEVVVRS